MPTDLQILDRIGLLIGGTQPDAANSPHFYSGSQVGDGTGVSGIVGCYSVPPETLPDPPVALILQESFELGGLGDRRIPWQGNEASEDNYRIWVLLWRNDLPTQYERLVPFRDSIPQLFRQHIQLSGLINIDALITNGRHGLMKWNGTDYLGWEFMLRVRQVLTPVYTDS